MKPTGVLFFPAFDWAISPTHPEREERLLYTRDQLFEEGIMDLPEIREYKPRLAEPIDIGAVHFVVPDQKASLLEAHFVAAGSTLVLADAYMKGEIKNGFAIVRPPGHHAMTVSHGNRGFCNINNEAIMIEYLRHKYGVKRVAVIDTDVHHGDGTQEIYYHDPDVLYVSFHQDGRTLYPGTGFMDEAGGPLAYGTTINVPLMPKTTDAGIHYVIDHLVLPLLEEFKPDLVVNSAGQDNHYTDPLADMRFTAQGYAELNHKLAPHIAVLEGGYSVETALPYINMGIIMAMAGMDYSNLREPDYARENFRESFRNLEAIKKMTETQLNLFRHRQDTIDKNRRSQGEFFSEYQRIFYDTDYIHEEQQMRLRNCPDCCGFRMLESTAQQRNGKLYQVLCISVPINCCSACHDQGAEVYQEMIRYDRYDYVYLQDRIKREYRSFNTEKAEESIIK
jgi:acetoin utilization deacetylase AcuC-like enzyme